jgi:hypothetical protein
MNDTAGARFERRVVVVGPREARPYEAREWRDALVMVERGEIELEGRAGGRARFGPGAVLALDDLPLRVLRSVGSGAAVLVAVRRSDAPGSWARTGDSSRRRGP